MKLLFTSLACVIALSLQAQTTFWTEGFGTGCNRGQTAAMYTGTNGAWTISNTGSNEPYPNMWYVSGTSSGTSVGVCNSNCLLAAADNQTLHIGNPAVLLA